MDPPESLFKQAGARIVKFHSSHTSHRPKYMYESKDECIGGIGEAAEGRQRQALEADDVVGPEWPLWRREVDARKLLVPCWPEGPS